MPEPEGPWVELQDRDAGANPRCERTTLPKRAAPEQILVPERQDRRDRFHDEDARIEMLCPSRYAEIVAEPPPQLRKKLSAVIAERALDQDNVKPPSGAVLHGMRGHHAPRSKIGIVRRSRSRSPATLHDVTYT